MHKILVAILASGIWINFSEFLRNELLFKHYWVEKYVALGLKFPSDSMNNAIWGVWGFLLAGSITFSARKLPLVSTVVISWTQAFLLMWIVIGNLNVLPLRLLPIAVPWSLVEVVVAALIIRKALGPVTA